MKKRGQKGKGKRGEEGEGEEEAEEGEEEGGEEGREEEGEEEGREGEAKEGEEPDKKKARTDASSSNTKGGASGSNAKLRRDPRHELYEKHSQAFRSNSERRQQELFETAGVVIFPPPTATLKPLETLYDALKTAIGDWSYDSAIFQSYEPRYPLRDGKPDLTKSPEELVATYGYRDRRGINKTDYSAGTEGKALETQKKIIREAFKRVESNPALVKAIRSITGHKNLTIVHGSAIFSESEEKASKWSGPQVTHCDEDPIEGSVIIFAALGVDYVVEVRILTCPV